MSENMIDITENFKRMMDRIERLKQKNHELTRENSRIIALISELSRNISELREANNVLQADLDLVKQCGFELWTTPEGIRVVIGYRAIYHPDRSKTGSKGDADDE